ncbi:MAG: helix-turn-helix domain-containing protein [Halobacteriaceae archaeon]
MAHAKFTLEIPDDIWIGSISRKYPSSEFEILAATANDSGGVALVELYGDHCTEIILDIDHADGVTDMEVFEQTDEHALLQVETQISVFIESAQRSGVPIETPFTVQDGEVTWELTVSRDRLSTLGEELDAMGINYTIESIYQQIDSEQLLTDQQWQVLQAALEHGYYDTPRTCTQEEIADITGLAKSTCSETLHRAEERIIKRLIGDRMDESLENPTRKVTVA